MRLNTCLLEIVRANCVVSIDHPRQWRVGQRPLSPPHATSHCQARQTSPGSPCVPLSDTANVALCPTVRHCKPRPRPTVRHGRPRGTLARRGRCVMLRSTLFFMSLGDANCKGVRCPPIFSLSNLINAGWLVRKCVNIYTSFNCWH